MRVVLLCLLTLLPWAQGEGAAPSPAPRPGVQLAAVHKGKVFTAMDAATFMRGDLTASPVVAHVYDFNHSLYEAPPRWRLAAGRLLRIDSDRQVPLPGLRKLRFTWDTSDLDDPILFRAGPQPKAAVGPPQERYGLTFPRVRKEALLTAMYWHIREHVNDNIMKVPDDKFPYHHYEFYYDLIPEGPKAEGLGYYKLFVLANGRLQRGIEKRRAEEASKPLPKGKKKRPPVYGPKLADAPGGPLDGGFLGVWAVDRRGQWALVEQIQPPFSERFQVFALGTTWFFVTDSGKVYAGKKPAKGKPRKLEPWWSEPGLPIIAVVQDAETGRTFLFGRAARKADKDFYVELGERPVPRPFVPADLKAVETVDPLKTMMQYAGLLVKDKKIALPKKAKK